MKKEEDWNSIRISYRGSGKVAVKLNGKTVAEVKVKQAEEASANVVTQELSAKGGEYELELEVEETEGLEILDVTMM